MAKTGRQVRWGGGRRDIALPQRAVAPSKGREILRREERLRIAPKHPGMGRR
jgi:hypothetical protein